jgi:triacylglycerol lipase
MFRPLLIGLVLVLATGVSETAETAGPRKRIGSVGRRDRLTRPLHPRRGWRERGQVRDVSGRFGELYRRAASGAAVLPPDATRYVYLVIPGAMGQKVPGYMGATQRHLRSRGLEVHRSGINTAAGVAENATTIRREILSLARGRRSVVLITHSKGGIDALAADAMFPDIRPLVRARVLMQPPFAGTPMAEVLDSGASRAALRMAGGSGALIDDLTGSARRDFNGARRHSWRIPTVSLASSHRGSRSILAPLGAIIRRRGGGDSDGMVPQSSQVVPGSHVVRVDGLDHWGAVLPVPGAAYRAGPLAEALVAVALGLKR